MFAVGLSYMAFIMLRYVPSMPAFWEGLYHKWMWNFVKGFSASIEIIICFPPPQHIYLFIYLLFCNTVLVLPYIDVNLPQVYMNSQSWTPLTPLSPYHLSGSSQCTSPKHPVSCIEPRLAIHFLHDSIHVSVPFSQIIPLSPSPIESKSLFYTSFNLLMWCITLIDLQIFKNPCIPGIEPTWSWCMII